MSTLILINDRSPKNETKVDDIMVSYLAVFGYGLFSDIYSVCQKKG